MRREKKWKKCRVSTWRNVHAGETIDKAGFRLRVSSHLYWMFESRGICRRWAFNRKFCRWILHSTKQLSVLSNLTRGKGLVITILTCNLTSTPQGLDTAEDALITFCFTRVSCDIQIRQLINDIKCASALGDCLPLNLSLSDIEITITTIPVDPFVVILSQIL